LLVNIDVRTYILTSNMSFLFRMGDADDDLSEEDAIARAIQMSMKDKDESK